MYIKIPTYNSLTQSWSHTEFNTKYELLKFIESLFKYPGQYNFDDDYYGTGYTKYEKSQRFLCFNDPHRHGHDRQPDRRRTTADSPGPNKRRNRRRGPQRNLQPRRHRPARLDPYPARQLSG